MYELANTRVANALDVPCAHCSCKLPAVVETATVPVIVIPLSEPTPRVLNVPLPANELIKNWARSPPDAAPTVRPSKNSSGVAPEGPVNPTLISPAVEPSTFSTQEIS